MNGGWGESRPATSAWHVRRWQWRAIAVVAGAWTFLNVAVRSPNGLMVAGAVDGVLLFCWLVRDITEGTQ